MGELELYGYASPKKYGIGGDLTVKPLDDLGLYLGGQYTNRLDWMVQGGLRWNW